MSKEKPSIMEVVDKKYSELKEKEPNYFTGKGWYKRDEIVNQLKQMKYCEEIAQELADWHLLHIQHAFNRGMFVGVKGVIEN